MTDMMDTTALTQDDGEKNKGNENTSPPIPPRLQPLTAAVTALKESTTPEESVKLAAQVKSLMASLSPPTVDARTLASNVHTRGEFEGKKRMTDAQKSAFECWKAGTLNPVQPQNWPLGQSTSACTKPRWEKLSKDLHVLYRRDDVTPADARVWFEHAAVSADMKELALAVRKVRMATGRVEARTGGARGGRALENSQTVLRRRARKELRVMKSVVKDMREAKQSLRGKFEQEIGALEEVRKEAAARRAVLRSFVDEDDSKGAGGKGKGMGKKAGKGLAGATALDSTTSGLVAELGIAAVGAGGGAGTGTSARVEGAHDGDNM